MHVERADFEMPGRFVNFDKIITLLPKKFRQICLKNKRIIHMAKQ